VGERTNNLQSFGVKTEAKRPLGSPRTKWDDDILMDLKWVWRAWTVFLQLRIGTGAGLL
jgi:hypothetical protein